MNQNFAHNYYFSQIPFINKNKNRTATCATLHKKIEIPIYDHIEIDDQLTEISSNFIHRLIQWRFSSNFVHFVKSFTKWKFRSFCPKASQFENFVHFLISKASIGPKAKAIILFLPPFINCKGCFSLFVNGKDPVVAWKLFSFHQRTLVQFGEWLTLMWK